MNVGIYFSNNPSDLGGGYTFEQEVLISLASIAQESTHNFIIFSQESIKKNIRINLSRNVRNVVIPTPNVFISHLKNFSQNFFPMSPFFKSLCLKFSKLETCARQNEIDIMVFCTPIYEPIDIPYITIVWDLQHRLQPWFPEVSEKGQWYGREISHLWSLQRASFIIAGTKAGQEEISRIYGVPKERIKIIPHPTPDFALNSEEDKKSDYIFNKFGIKTKFLLYPAQFWPHKNHANILLALKIFKEKYNVPLSLVFVGSDKGNFSYIQNMTIELQLSDDVHFLGFVSRDDLASLYKNAFALLYPTFFGPENLPPLEAFALGCPVIASNVSGADEQLGNAALLVDPKSPEQIADTIYKLYNSMDLRKTLIERGSKRAQQWTGQDFVRSIFSILNEFEAIRRCWK